MSLEEAEKRMNAMEKGVRLNASSKLGALAAKGNAQPPPRSISSLAMYSFTG